MGEEQCTPTPHSHGPDFKSHTMRILFIKKHTQRRLISEGRLAIKPTLRPKIPAECEPTQWRAAGTSGALLPRDAPQDASPFTGPPHRQVGRVKSTGINSSKYINGVLGRGKGNSPACRWSHWVSAGTSCIHLMPLGRSYHQAMARVSLRLPTALRRPRLLPLPPGAPCRTTHALQHTPPHRPARLLADDSRTLKPMARGVLMVALGQTTQLILRSKYLKYLSHPYHVLDFSKVFPQS